MQLYAPLVFIHMDDLGQMPDSHSSISAIIRKVGSNSVFSILNPVDPLASVSNLYLGTL